MLHSLCVSLPLHLPQCCLRGCLHMAHRASAQPFGLRTYAHSWMLPRPTVAFRITRADLAAGLQRTLAAEPLFAPFVVPLIAEKLSSSLRCLLVCMHACLFLPGCHIVNCSAGANSCVPEECRPWARTCTPSPLPPAFTPMRRPLQAGKAGCAVAAGSLCRKLWPFSPG